MFEIIFGAVCLAVLAVEVIEVRQKCEESYLGMWDETHPLHLHSASLTGARDETGGHGWRGGEGKHPR